MATLFNTLERQKGLYGVKEWGISQASLEEVFIKIAEKSEEDQEGPGARAQSGASALDSL